MANASGQSGNGHHEDFADPWNLLSKAENWRKFGLGTSAVVAADEAVEAQLKKSFDELGLQKPDSLEDAVCYLRKEGAKLSTERMLVLREIRRKSELNSEDDLPQSEVEEALAIAEEAISVMCEQLESVAGTAGLSTRHSRAFCFGKVAKKAKLVSPSPSDPFDIVRSTSAGKAKDAQVETEFVAKLLLARAILGYKKKWVPHSAGLVATLILLVPFIFFGIVGASGIILMLTGRLFFSIIGLLFDILFLFIAYTSLKIVFLVRRQTR